MLPEEQVGRAAQCPGCGNALALISIPGLTLGAPRLNMLPFPRPRRPGGRKERPSPPPPPSLLLAGRGHSHRRGKSFRMSECCGFQGAGHRPSQGPAAAPGRGTRRGHTSAQAPASPCAQVDKGPTLSGSHLLASVASPQDVAWDTRLPQSQDMGGHAPPRPRHGWAWGALRRPSCGTLHPGGSVSGTGLWGTANQQVPLRPPQPPLQGV